LRGATLPRDVDFSDDVDPIPHHREPLKSAADTHCRVSRRIAADVSHDGIREYTKRDQFKP
jgi:hypothetical protein